MKRTKRGKKNRLLAILSAAVLAVTGTAAAAGSLSTGASYNDDWTYGDALKLSLYFYDGNQCGTEVDDNPLTWRGNCHTYDAQAPLSNATGLSSSSISAIEDANGGSTTVDVSGGYHDAGDHLKFSMTMGFSATNLAWSYLENPDAYDQTGSTDHLLYILKNFCDYFMKVTYLDSSDSVIAFCYMVGGEEDHNYWTVPEAQTMDRPTYWADSSHPSVDTSSFMSSAFSACYLAFKDVNPDYADELLVYAKALNDFTQKYPTASYDGVGSYYSCGETVDKTAWSDLWYAYASNDGTLPSSFTAKSVSNGVYNGSDYDYWVYSWGKVWGGYSALLYSIDPSKYSAHGQTLVFDMNQLYSSTGDTYYTVGGGWGASRYNCAWQMYALTYAKYSGDSSYTSLAAKQMDLLLGKVYGTSYVLGYGSTWPTHIHHRAANPGSGSSTDNSDATYTLYGALVGGPTDNTGTQYTDDKNSYDCTEPALDYNGCLALAIAGLVSAYEDYGTTMADQTIANASEINADYVFEYGATSTPSVSTTEESTTTETTTTTSLTTTESTTTTSTTTTEETTTTERETTLNPETTGETTTTSASTARTIEIYKVDAEDTSTVLNGATFDITGVDASGNAISLRFDGGISTGSGGSYVLNLGSYDNPYAENYYNFTLGSMWTFTILPDGTYTLTESNAPDGYKRADPFTITVEDMEIVDVGGEGASAVIWDKDANSITVMDEQGVDDPIVTTVVTTTLETTEMTTTEAYNPHPSRTTTSSAVTSSVTASETSTETSKTEAVVVTNEATTEAVEDSGETTTQAANVNVSTILGDPNCDGKIDLSDVVYLTKIVAGVIPKANVSQQTFDNGDCNKDGDLTDRDVLILLRYQVGLVSLPCLDE